MVRDPRQEGARGNAVKASRILPVAVREAWDQVEAAADIMARVKEAMIEVEAPVGAGATVNI